MSLGADIQGKGGAGEFETKSESLNPGMGKAHNANDTPFPHKEWGRTW